MVRGCQSKEHSINVCVIFGGQRRRSAVCDIGAICGEHAYVDYKRPLRSCTAANLFWC